MWSLSDLLSTYEVTTLKCKNAKINTIVVKPIVAPSSLREMLCDGASAGWCLPVLVKHQPVSSTTSDNSEESQEKKNFFFF